ncbi:MAG: efflux RND transporter periplasmic adaptor subunit [Planctomycetota bacterium]
MMKKILIGLLAVVLVIGFAGGAWRFRAEFSELWHGIHGKKGNHDNGHDRVHEEQVGHEGHEHEEESGADLAMTVEEVLAAQCEHNMPTYQCAECRYEVGVVKVKPLIVKSAENGKGVVATLSVAEKEIRNILTVTGEVQRNENTAVHISPRISGVIRSVHVDIGAEVKQGDVLFEIDSVELGQATSEYQRNRALADLSRRNFEREKSLFERKIASEQEMIEAQMKYEEYKTEFEASEQKLHVLGLTDKEIAAIGHGAEGGLSTRAPRGGTILDKHAVIGEMVEPGKDVMLLADLQTVWVWADIYEKDLATLIEAQKKERIPVEVSVHAFPKTTFKGEIDYIGATMEERTRTVKVRATVENGERLLRPGMFCTIHIALSTGEKALAIPKTALLSDEGRHFVFKHLKEDYYVRRPVKPGREFDGSVEILEGMKAGETIVADGAFLLKSDVLRSKMGAGCAD